MGLFSCFSASRRGRPGKEGTSFDDIGKFGDEKPEVPESTGVSEGVYSNGRDYKLAELTQHSHSYMDYVVTEGSLNHQKEQTRSGIADRQEMFISKQPSSSQPSAHGSRLTEYSIKDHSDPQPSPLLHPHVNLSSTPLNPNRGGSQPQIHIPSPLPPQDSFNSPTIAGSRRSDLEMPMSPTSSINPSSPLRQSSVVAKDDGTYSNPATPNTTRIPAPVRSGLQGTPSELQGTPSFKQQAAPLMSPTPSMKAIISATNAATSPAAVPLNTGRDGMTSLTLSSSSPLSPVDGAGIITPAAISEGSPPGLVRQGSDLSDLSGPDDEYQKYGGDSESEEEEEEDTAPGYEEETAEAADWTPEQVAAGAASGQQQQQQEAEEMLRKAAVDAITAQSGGAVASGGAAMPLALAAAKAREARQSYVAAGGGGGGAFSPSALQATGITGAFSPNAAARAGGGGGALSPSGARYQTGSRDNNAVAVSPTASRRVDAGPGVFGSTYEQSSRTSAIMTASQPALQPGTTTTASSLPRAPEVTIPSDSSSPIVGKVASSFQQPVGSATSSELTDDAVRSPGSKPREEDASEDANPELIHSTCSSWSSPGPGHYDSNATSPTAAAATADAASASDTVSVKPSDIKPASDTVSVKPSDIKPSFLETVARSNELMDSATSKEAVRQQLQQAVQLNNETVPLQSTEERFPHSRSPNVSFEPSRTSALPVDQHHTPHHVIKAFPADATPVMTPEVDRLLSAATDSAAAAAATFKASTELPNNTFSSSSSSSSLKRTGSMQAAGSSGIPASPAEASTPSSGRSIKDEVELLRRSTSSLPSYMRTTASSGSKAAPLSTHSATPPARVSAAESGRGSRRSSECGEGGDCKTIPVNNSSSKPKAGLHLPPQGASSRTIPSKSPEPPSGGSFSRPGSSSASKPPVPLPSSRSSRDMSSSASKLSAAVAAAGPTSTSLKANYSASSNKALGPVPTTTTQSTMISAQDNVQATNVPATAAASSDLRRSTSLNKGQAISNAATGSRSAQSGTTQPSSTAATSLGATTTAAPIINNTGTSDAAAGTNNTDAAAAPAPEAATAVPAADAGSSSDTKLSPRSSANMPSAAASPARAAAAGLPFGSFRLVRLKKAVNCDACTGTTEQETHDGLKEVFQCDVTLQPGSLAVIVAHDVEAEGAADSTRLPRTWVFCPDPLCLDSKPQGSSLPSWPKKLPLEGGMKIVRSEYNKLLEVGLDIQAPQKQQTKSSPARTSAATVNPADDDNKQEPAVLLSSTHGLASGTAMTT